MSLASWLTVLGWAGVCLQAARLQDECTQQKLDMERYELGMEALKVRVLLSLTQVVDVALLW